MGSYRIDKIANHPVSRNDSSRDKNILVAVTVLLKSTPLPIVLTLKI